MSDIDFGSEQVQQASWDMIRAVMLNAVHEAIARARALYPAHDASSIAVRDGMIINQLHMIVAELLGETEGKILRLTMITDEAVVKQRQARLETGRVGNTVKT